METVIKIDDLGVTDNFFKLGGDSILVIQLTNMIKNRDMMYLPNDI